jgi:hypothetical protein
MELHSGGADLGTTTDGRLTAENRRNLEETLSRAEAKEMPEAHPFFP